MSTESSPASRVRASDAEREEYASIVRESVGDGRLSLAEGDERLAQIYAARHRDDLRPLIADLPQGQDAVRRGYGPGSGPGGPGFGGPGFGGPGFGRPGYRGFGGPGYRRWGGPDGGPSDAPVRRGPAVARHTGFVLVVAAALTGLWLVSGASFFWPAIPLTFLVLSLARHAFGLGWRRRW
jgi:hypothetical protein